MVFLIADDDPDDQFLINRAIEDNCAQLVEAIIVWDGKQVMETLKERTKEGLSKPQMIMLDLNMPRKDGRSTLRDIKADPRFKDIPVAVLTNSNDPTDIEFCQENGAIGCFQKPNTISELNLIIRTLCEYVSYKTNH